MKYLALSLALILSVCAAEPAFAHVDLKPIKWWAVFVWQDKRGGHALSPASVDGTHMPQRFNSRKTCERLAAMNARGLNEKYGSGFSSPTVYVVCIAARHKLQLRNHLRNLDLNFGGRPA